MLNPVEAPKEACSPQEDSPSSMLSAPLPHRHDPAGREPRLGHFDVTFLNRDGKRVGSHTFSFECSTQDSCEAVVYSYERGKLCLALEDRPPFGLHARPTLPVLREKEGSAMLLSLPQAVSSERGYLGGPYLPSAGSSTELCTLVPMPVAVAGARYHGMSMIPVDSILSRYLQGIPVNTRVVLAALRLADFLGYHLPNTLQLGHNSGQLGPLCRHVFRANAEQLRRHLLAPPSDSAAAYTLVCTRGKAPQESFMNFRQVIEASDTEVLVRKGIDAVDVGAYTWDGKELSMVLKRGLRPVLAARKILRGDNPGPTEALAYEGIAESLEGETTLTEIGERAAQGVREEAGIEPCSTPLYVGSSFPTPTKHAERVFNFLVEVDPRRAIDADHTVDERVDVFVVPVEEVLALCNDGTIKDPRLEINARLLASHAR